MTSIFNLFIIIPIINILLLAVNFILAPHKPYKEKKTPFECGYHSFLAQNRTQFNISFFLFGLLFLLFDIEIVIIYPITVSSYFNEGYGIFVVISFVLILALGLVFELGKGALKIETKQQRVSLQSNFFAYVKFAFLGLRCWNKSIPVFGTSIKVYESQYRIIHFTYKLDQKIIFCHFVDGRGYSVWEAMWIVYTGRYTIFHACSDNYLVEKETEEKLEAIKPEKKNLKPWS